MGVQITLEELNVREYDGSTPAKHAELTQRVEGKVVAVDGNLWMQQSRQTAGMVNRMDGMRHAAGGDDELAALHSALLLFVDRCTQLLRYGGHPVVVCFCAARFACVRGRDCGPALATGPSALCTANVPGFFRETAL